MMRGNMSLRGVQGVVFLLGVAWGSWCAGEESWPRFHGPNGAGEVEADAFPLQWTAKECRWKVALPGIGHSSPVVWGDRVVVTSSPGDDATQVVLCLRTSDGGTLWKREFPVSRYPKSSLNSYASATPALDGVRAYVTWATPEQYTVAALGLNDGRELWRRALGPFRSQHGFGPSPIVWEDLVIVPNDQDGPSSVVALDRATGAIRWQSPRRTEKAAFSVPCIFSPSPANDARKPQLILSSWANGVSGLDPRSGKTLWELPVFENRVVGSPVVAAGLIFAAAGTGGIGRQMVAIRPGDPDRGVKPKVAYHIQNPIPYVPTPVVKGNLLFLWQDQGIVACLDAPSGKTLWRERVGGNFFASPVCAGQRLYCPSRTGEMVVLAAAEKYQLLAKFPLGEATESTPALAGGSIYVRTLSHLMAVGK